MLQPINGLVVSVRAGDQFQHLDKKLGTYVILSTVELQLCIAIRTKMLKFAALILLMY